MSSTTNSETYAGSYRIKFSRNEFLNLLKIAKPAILYRISNFIFFNFDGFTMYCSKLTEEDLMPYNVLTGIEFSNVSWTKRK